MAQPGQQSAASWAGPNLYWRCPGNTYAHLVYELMNASELLQGLTREAKKKAQAVPVSAFIAQVGVGGGGGGAGVLGLVPLVPLVELVTLVQIWQLCMGRSQHEDALRQVEWAP